MSCDNCGLAEGALVGPGRKIQLTRRASNKFKRDHKVTAWVCSEECGVQALGIAKYGAASREWPVTLAQWRTTVKRQKLLGDIHNCSEN